MVADPLGETTFMGCPVFPSWEAARDEALQHKPIVEVDQHEVSIDPTHVEFMSGLKRVYKPQVRGVKLFGVWWYMVLRPSRQSWSFPRIWPDPRYDTGLTAG